MHFVVVATSLAFDPCSEFADNLGFDAVVAVISTRFARVACVIAAFKRQQFGPGRRAEVAGQFWHV